MDSSFFLVLVAAAICFFMLFTKFRFQQDNNDTNSSSLSLPSPSTSMSRIWKHHVFPSFHGADVRKTFLSHILESFRRKGIDPFIDSDIERSKSIGPELIEAIRGSKIAIVLLSRNYASSSWCLEELVEIMKCREELSQIVMTIFYEVDPTEVKKQTGDFGKAFRKTCKAKTKEHTARWRKALEDVATIAGEHSRNWSYEAAMIEKIATDVSNMLNNFTPSRDFDGLVGMRAHMERMEQLLRLDLDEVRMIGIWGPPGIGKTTIARVLFNQISSRFQLGAIMFNIKGCYPRHCLDEYSAQLQLQNRMLSQIINQKDIVISHLGVAKERLKNKKVFLVLDDVDRLGQLNALAKKNEWFGSGSRIIIITEDLSVLNAHGINHIYKVNFPSWDEAFQIFCMDAFGQTYPDDGFSELAWKVMALAGNLPLELKVLGSVVRGMSKQEWERTLPRLKSDRNPKEAEIVQAEARDRYTEFSTGNYGAKPESSSSEAKTNTDLLDRTFTNSRMDGIAIKQSLDELKEKLDLNKIRSQLGMIIGCLLLLFFVAAYMSTRLIGERGAIDRIAVNVPKMPKYIPAEGTENPRDRCTEISTGNYGAKPESSSSDAKTNTDLLDRTLTNSRMYCKVKPPKIQVFINFRGVQLRNNFVGYLVDALRRSEINVFIDNHEKRGEDLNTLFKRIEDSGIAIVVFSSRYTESKWCLQELVKIKERVRLGLLKVLPIFYKVTPTNVKRLKGEFGDHFREKEYKYESDEPTIKQWKEAIMFVSHKFALTLDEKSVLEIDFVETIVKEVLEMLQAISKVKGGQSSR